MNLSVYDNEFSYFPSPLSRWIPTRLVKTVITTLCCLPPNRIWSSKSHGKRKLSKPDQFLNPKLQNLYKNWLFNHGNNYFLTNLWMIRLMLSIIGLEITLKNIFLKKKLRCQLWTKNGWPPPETNTQKYVQGILQKQTEWKIQKVKI